jgi:tripartite-type tricarboxylate transporter receptor subunit TctC
VKPVHRGSTRRAALLGLGAAALAGRAAPVSAQGRFPERPIVLLVPFAPGGIADLTARAVAEQMGRRLGQPVVVENKPSAGSIVASQAVASARPDGHTLLLMSNGNAVSASLFKKLPYDTLRAFAPITTLASFDLGLFVAADSPLRSLAELLAQARAQPGRLKVGSITPGSTQHLSAKLFETVAGVELLVVPYKGTPAVLMALRAGEIDLALEVTGPLLPQLRAGVLRVLAVTGTQRNPALPDVPTVQQAGLAGYEVASWNALAAPAGTPAEVLQRLARAAHEALATPELQARLGPLGLRLQPGTPAELQALLAAEVQRWGGVIRAANIQPE